MAMLSGNMVKQAGKALKNYDSDDERFLRALDVLDDWKFCHREIMDSAVQRLFDCAMSIDPDAIVVGRIKRTDSIIAKLCRPGESYNLNQLGDIAGCRAIVESPDNVTALVARLRGDGLFEVRKDHGYISSPKPSGYRSYHLIWQAPSGAGQSRRLSCEVQVRTRLQHAWATGFEVYGRICDIDIKSGEGSSEEKEFFKLLADCFASLEPGLDRNNSILPLNRLFQLNDRLHVAEKIEAANNAVTLLGSDDLGTKEGYCLITTDYGEQTIDVCFYPSEDERDAYTEYARFERDKKEPGSIDGVLVRVSSSQNLMKAYPLYSACGDLFVEAWRRLESYR